MSSIAIQPHEAYNCVKPMSGKGHVPCRVFGWTPKNEITNGRWVMMGIGIGLLTEYATGVDFPNQLKLMLSYLGIADVYD